MLKMSSPTSKPKASDSVRSRLEAWENEKLAPYALRSSQHGGREHPVGDQDLRTEFQRDRDRVIYSKAFRRLEYKTQVFPNHEGDHYRTRLTHTIEVANLCRSLARSLCLNEDFSECLALVHDIGHPPFGHCGEEVLAKLMKLHGGFEHNEQSYRLITQLEKAYPGYPGLNLTFEIRQAVLQHTKNYKKRYPKAKPARLETHLCSIADEMVYDAHDVDDGLASGILQIDQLKSLKLWQQVMRDPEYPHRSCPELERSVGVRTLLNLLVTDFTRTSLEKLCAKNPSSSDAARSLAASVLVFSKSMSEQKVELEFFLRRSMYKHPKVLKMTNKSRYFMERLFLHFREYSQELPLDFQERFSEDGVERTVADYIAGMTDRFLQEEYTRIFMPFQRML